MQRLAGDPAFANVKLADVLNAKKYVGRAPEQVDEFVKEYVTPIRRRYRKVLAKKSELSV